jgi:hypothetical protein
MIHTKYSLDTIESIKEGLFVIDMLPDIEHRVDKYVDFQSRDANVKGCPVLYESMSGCHSSLTADDNSAPITGI